VISELSPEVGHHLVKWEIGGYYKGSEGAAPDPARLSRPVGPNTVTVIHSP